MENMPMPVKLTKPTLRTSTTCDVIHVFEVELGGAEPARFEPRPPVGFSVDDAILALAMTLKDMNTTPSDFLEHFKDQTFIVSQSAVLYYEGKPTAEKKFNAPIQDVAIRRKLGEFFPSATTTQGHAPALVVQEQPEDLGPRMISMANSGSQSAPNTSSSRVVKGAAPKERRLITIQGGGGESKQEALQAAVAMLTPENIPSGGMVITMGKNGPRLLKTAGARTDEEEGEAMADAEEQGVSITGGSHRAPEEVVLTPAISKGAAQPKPAAKVARTISESQLSSMAKSAAASAPSHSILDAKGVEMSMDPDEAGAMIDAELGTTGQDADFELEGPVLSRGEDEQSASELSETEHRGSRAIKRPSVTKSGRGGTRPTKV